MNIYINKIKKEVFMQMKKKLFAAIAAVAVAASGLAVSVSADELTEDVDYGYEEALDEAEVDPAEEYEDVVEQISEEDDVPDPSSDFDTQVEYQEGEEDDYEINDAYQPPQLPPQQPVVTAPVSDAPVPSVPSPKTGNPAAAPLAAVMLASASAAVIVKKLGDKEKNSK